MVLMNISSVQIPVPVNCSGVRLRAYEMPQGPAKAVFVAAPDHSQGPSDFGGGGITTFSGWPLSARVMSGSGPFGPTLNGVWQSLQPPMVTRYSPRATRDCLVGTDIVSGVTGTFFELMARAATT